MESIVLHDKRFKPYLSAEKIHAAVKQMASTVSKDYEGLCPLIVVVLKGSFIFAADLVRELNMDCQLSFIRLSSYEGTSSSGTVSSLMQLDTDITNRHIIVIEDIIDTGTTIDFLLKAFQTQQPKSLKIASLLFKPKAFKGNYTIDYTGFEIPNDFIVGYGLDYNELGRNLKDIYVIAE